MRFGGRPQGLALVVWIGAAGWLWCAPAASATPIETVTLGATQDNTLFSTETTSNGAGDAVFSGRTGEVAGGGTRQRALLIFDVAAAVPAGSTILSATLTLTLIAAPPGAAAQVHSLHRVLADWGEGSSAAFGGQGAPAQPGDATWLHAFFP